MIKINIDKDKNGKPYVEVYDDTEMLRLRLTSQEIKINYQPYDHCGLQEFMSWKQLND